MKKRILHVVLAALFSLVIFCVFSILIAAVLDSTESVFLRNLILAIIATVVYALSLLYLSKIRDDVGDFEVFEDYPENSDFSLSKDFQFVMKRETVTVVIICSVIFLCYVMNVLWIGVLQNERAFPLSMLFSALTVFQSFFPIADCGYILNLVGHMLSTAIMSFFYLLSVLMYRRYLYLKNEKI